MIRSLIRPLLTVWHDPVSGVYVAGIPSAEHLPLSQGETEAEALDATADALALYLKHYYRRGLLLRVLWDTLHGIVDDKLEDYRLSRSIRPVYEDVASRLRQQ